MYRANAPYHTTHHIENSTQRSRMLHTGHRYRTAVPNYAEKLSMQPETSENLKLQQFGNHALRCPDTIRTERASAEPISSPVWFGAQSRPNALRNFSAESRQALVAEFGVDLSYKRANGSIVTNATNAEEKQ
ncbi:Developmental and secondary metabolism regulator veA [Penicillium angulare]|uniref:Developmental and secondary metabolism regulator veA n=1 Tax=Penicillium angulare TaxID=116970 RepID=A0A9W9FIX8_9EURO|nr:Developmental and secondary metabolism regulator veA [Penicillium angulare]KAJ5100990.1 Developmental and secondary metabolism regulator veA [Penicillium angulare]